MYPTDTNAEIAHLRHDEAIRAALRAPGAELRKPSTRALRPRLSREWPLAPASPGALGHVR